MAKRWLIPQAIPSQWSLQPISTGQDLTGKVIPPARERVPDPIRDYGGSRREAMAPSGLFPSPPSMCQCSGELHRSASIPRVPLSSTAMATAMVPPAAPSPCGVHRALLQAGHKDWHPHGIWSHRDGSWFSPPKGDSRVPGGNQVSRWGSSAATHHHQVGAWSPTVPLAAKLQLDPWAYPLSLPRTPTTSPASYSALLLSGKGAQAVSWVIENTPAPSATGSPPLAACV